MMRSRKSVKSEEESSEKRIPEISEEADPVGLEELCPFQEQGIIWVHCRTDCAWYSDDQCCIWDLIAALRGIRTALEKEKTLEGIVKFQR
jgi:hypothetical protein